MSMSKKDYELLVRSLSSTAATLVAVAQEPSVKPVIEASMNIVVMRLSADLKKNYKGFDQGMFLAAYDGALRIAKREVAAQVAGKR